MRKQQHNNSIRRQLFTQVAVIVTATSLALTLVSSIIVRDIMEERARQEISQTSASIAKQFSQVIASMESVAREIQYSTAFKEGFYRMVHASSPFVANPLRDELHAQVKSIFQATRSSPKLISVQSLYGHEVTVGADLEPYITSPQAINTNVLLLRAQVKRGAPILSTPHYSSGGGLAVSVVSFLADPDTTKQLTFDAFVEVQQPYEAFTDIIEQATGDTGIQVIVVKNDGSFIIPAQKNIYEQSCLYSGIRSTIDTAITSQSYADVFSAKHPLTEETLICGFSAAEEVGLRVIVYETETMYLAGMRRNIMTMALLSLGLLFVSLVVTWCTASRITAPITALRREVSSINLHTLQRETDVEFVHHEYVDLHHSFNDMLVKLRASVDEIVDLKQKEMRTRLYVLQSKMDPHFLNNAIALIQIYARKEDMESIKEICTHLNGMTRYLYKTTSEVVPLSAELEYTAHYLNMMKTRYPNNLFSSIDVPEDMLQIMMPKLIIQPLVENCFKHGMAIEPPWEISIRGKLLDGDRYCIEVQDNGIGFSDETRRNLLESNLSDLHQAPGIDGIGLMNIMARIRLIYGDSAILAIESPEKGGAIVRIGGDIHAGRLFENE